MPDNPEQANPEQANPEQANPEQANPEQANPEQDDFSHVQPRDCSICRLPIPLERLGALPRTQFCMSCGGSRASLVVHDPEALCAKSSPSGQNGWSQSS